MGLSINNVSLPTFNVELKSSWNNGASKLTFSLLGDKNSVKNGDYVTFIHEGNEVFAGFVFEHALQRDGVVKVTCYDQLRYFKAKDSVIRKNMSLKQFVKSRCEALGLRTGELEDSAVTLEPYLFDNQTNLDMIYESINTNLLLNGYYYCLRDEFGKVALKELYSLRLPLQLGDMSGVYDFQSTSSIDVDTYNRVKLAKDNEASGKRDVYIAQDSSTFDTFGVLQYFEKVTSDLNESQLKERAEMLLKVKNRETKKLELSALGDSTVLGGNGIYVKIEEAGIDGWAIVESVTHKFTNPYTMKLSLIIEEGNV